MVMRLFFLVCGMLMKVLLNWVSWLMNLECLVLLVLVVMLVRKVWFSLLLVILCSILRVKWCGFGFLSMLVVVFFFLGR